jgi:hypothetical protein
MSDSQRPNPPAPAPMFEVPDLELEPVARPHRQAAPAPTRRPPSVKAPESAPDQLFGSTFDFGGDLDELEFERSAQPNSQLGGQSAPRLVLAKQAEPVATDAGASWPSGRALQAAELEIDPRELAILADYGDPPANAPQSLAYAYRVFTRQRELKHQLIPIAAECERAQIAREATLAEFAGAMRGSIEQNPEFRRFFLPLLALEQRALERAKALTAVNAELGAETGQVDAELAQIASQLELEAGIEREAQRQYDEREANAKRTDAKWKRVQIEMRAVTQVAEQKLGPQGGQIPDAEAAELADLRKRAETLLPKREQALAEFEQAKQALARLHARRDALRQGQQKVARKKQALGGAYQTELAARAEGVSESEVELRAALADLARAVLAARGTIELPEEWLERVSRACSHADRLLVRAEMLCRAIASYDHERARQGVRLACTATGLVFALFAFKLIF